MNLNTEVKNWKCAKMITGIVQIFFYMNKNSIFFSGYIICVYKLHSTLQLWLEQLVFISFCLFYTPHPNWVIGSTQWTNPIEPRILKYSINIIKMPLCKIFLLTRSHMPANQHQLDYQKLAAGLVLVGKYMVSSKHEDFRPVHFQNLKYTLCIVVLSFFFDQTICVVTGLLSLLPQLPKAGWWF